MTGINEIKKPIAADIDAFEEKFKDSMHSPVPLLDRITHYIVKRKGKQIRPMFVFFSASICGGSMNRHTAGLLWLNCFIRQRWCMTMWWTIRISDADFFR